MKEAATHNEHYKVWFRAAVRATAGKPGKFRAQWAFDYWVDGLTRCCDPKLPQAEVNRVHDKLHRAMVAEFQSAYKTRNADFFRRFADAIEERGRNWCDVRAWLVEKHAWRDEKAPPKFTSTELLDDSDRLGLNVSLRQLTRLMAELGFKFKNARR